MDGYILPGYLKEPFDFTKYWSFEEILDSVKGKLWLSVVGGRICYSAVPVLDILKLDKRLKSPESIADYLRRLSLVYNHTSVIAHTPVALPVKPEFDREVSFWQELGLRVYKWFYNPATKQIVFTLRHIVEHLSNAGKRDLVNELFSKASKEYFELEQQNIQNAINWITNSISKNRRAGILYADSNWISLAVGLDSNTYVSRVLSHQLVRHTVLNFNQMSQRYVKLTENVFIIPPSIEANSSANKVYKLGIADSLRRYSKLINEYGIPKEDARFIIPQAVYTRLIVSGTVADVKDFVSKRIEKNAQWEIRMLAKDILDSMNELVTQI